MAVKHRQHRGRPDERAPLKHRKERGPRAADSAREEGFGPGASNEPEVERRAEPSSAPEPGPELEIEIVEARPEEELPHEEEGEPESEAEAAFEVLTGGEPEGAEEGEAEAAFEVLVGGEPVAEGEGEFEAQASAEPEGQEEEGEAEAAFEAPSGAGPAEGEEEVEVGPQAGAESVGEGQFDSEWRAGFGPGGPSEFESEAQAGEQLPAVAGPAEGVASAHGPAQAASQTAEPTPLSPALARDAAGITIPGAAPADQADNTQEAAVADNTIQQLKAALTQLNTMLDDPTLKQGFSQIPDSIKSPIKEGLNKVLGVLNTALNELKSKLGAVTTVQGLLGVINNLLSAAEGLAPGEKATLDQVKGIVSTLQALPGAQQIDEIIALIQQITGKLAAL